MNKDTEFINIMRQTTYFVLYCTLREMGAGGGRMGAGMAAGENIGGNEKGVFDGRKQPKATGGIIYNRNIGKEKAKLGARMESGKNKQRAAGYFAMLNIEKMFYGCNKQQINRFLEKHRRRNGNRTNRAGRRTNYKKDA